LTAYGASSGSTWVVGNANGVLYDGASAGGTPRYLDYGAMTGVAASAGDFAVATASNRVLYFNAANNALEGTISQPTLQGGEGSNVQLSADGTVLAVATNGTEPPFLPSVSGVISTYTLPAGTPTASFPVAPPEVVTNMSLSGSGTVLGAAFANASSCFGEVIAVSSGATLLCLSSNSTTPVSILLSADGTGVAAAPLFSQDNTNNGGNYGTNIYVNGALATAVPGIVQGWLSPTTVLVASYAYTGPSPADQSDQYVSSSIYNVSGSLVS